MTCFTPLSGVNDASGGDDDAKRLAQIERTIAAVRVATVSSIAAWLGIGAEDVAYPALAWATVVIAAVYSCAVIAWRRSFYATHRGALVLASTDAGLTLLVIASTGASRSPAIAILFLVVITAAMRFDMRHALLLSLVNCGAYAFLALLVPEPDATSADRVEAALWWPFYLVAAAVLTGTLSRLAKVEHRLRVRAETTATTARQRAAHLEALDAEREETLRVVVHEFRAPVASLRALARELRRDKPGEGLADAAAAQATRLIQDHADHLADMCEAMRDAISGGGLKAFEGGTPFHVPLRVVVQGAVAAASVGASEVKVDVDPPEATVSLDPTQLRRIVTNLVENALRHNPAGSPPVTVDARLDGETVVLAVADHGLGLPEGQADLVLRKGSRLGPASGTQGLGLWIVNRLVEKMGGSLALANRPDGGGLRVVVTLPARVASS